MGEKRKASVARDEHFVLPTSQQLAVVQRASQSSHAGAVVRDVPLLQCIGNLTVRLDPAQTGNFLIYI